MILVAGMHRSGTSAITRVLNLCGATLSSKLLRPVKKDNDTGFWESQKIMELHDEIFASLQCTWSSLAAVPPEWFSSAEALTFRARLISLIESEYGEFSLGVVKDPRICKLVPLWESALKDMGVQSHYIVSLRNPLEIAKSLERRNGFKQTYALSLWFVHLRWLEKNTRGLNRVFVQYGHLLTDASSTVERISKCFGLELDYENTETQTLIDAFLSESLRHHRIDSAALQNKRSVPAVVKYLYAWLERQSSLECKAIDLREAPNVEQEIAKYANSDFVLYLQNLAAMERALDHRYLVEREQALTISLYSDQKKQLENRLSQSDLIVQQERQNVVDAESELSELKKALTTDGSQILELQQALIKSRSKILDIQESLTRSVSQASEMMNSLHVRDKRISELKCHIQTLEDDYRRESEEWDVSRSGFKTEIERLTSAQAVSDGLSSLNGQLSHDLRVLNVRIHDMGHTTAWALGAKLCHHIKSIRSSKVGLFLLLVKASCAFNLKGYLAFRKRINIVAQSGLFDTEYYLRTYPLIAYSIKTPLEHYMGHGEREGRQPNQIFAPYYYRQQVADGENRWGSELVHYIMHGAEEGLNPSPLFSSKAYQALHSIEGQNPLTHYLMSNAELRTDEPHQDTGENDVQTHLSGPTRHQEHSADPLQHEVASLIEEVTALTFEEKIATISFNSPSKPEVSILIPFFNKFEYTVDCLYALQKQGFKNFEVILVDDASDDADCSKLARIKGVKFIRNTHNLGYLLSCNLAAKEAKGNYIVQLNNDTLPLDGWLEHLLNTFRHFPDAAIAGSMMLDSKGVIQEAGGIIFSDASGYNYGRGLNPSERRFNFCRDVDFCSGASIIIKRSVWEQLGGYDVLFAPAYYEDADIAMQAISQGHRVIYNPFSKIVHHEGVSCGKDTESGIKTFQKVNKTKFYVKWKNQLSLRPPQPPAGHIDQYVRRETKSGAILWIDSNTPTPDKDAGSIETIHFFERALADNWTVSFIPWDALRHEGRYTTDLQYMGVECIYGPESTAAACLSSLTGFYDIVVLSRATVAKHTFPLVKSLFPKSKLIFNTVDLHFLRYERELELLRRYPTFKMPARSQKVEKDDEIFLVRECDATIVVSDVEEKILRQSVPDANIKVIPLFGDVVGRSNDYAQRANIGFIGGYQHPPNIDAVKYFVSDVWPLVRKKLKNCKFIIAGSNATDEVLNLAGPTVEVRGFVPEVQEFLEEVRVMVAPLRYGAGIKGKVVSGLCYGVPQVVSAEAAEGMGLEHSKDAMIAGNSEQFANHIIDLYSNPKRWEKISDGAKHKADRLYSKQTLSIKISELLSELS